MSILFDRKVAKKLLAKMNAFSGSIEANTRDLLRILDSSSSWKDSQQVAFRNNMMGVAKDIDQAFRNEYEYANIYQKKIKELESGE